MPPALEIAVTFFTVYVTLSYDVIPPPTVAEQRREF
jgi:hypothetical protein